MSESKIYNSSLLPDLLPMYYSRLFPYDLYYKWLVYDNDNKSFFSHREFSFTLADDIYIRYQSFKDQEEMEAEIKRKCPHKIDIGAVYTFRPKDRKNVSVFTPIEKELVFDIDMTDYDEVRYCCSGAEICSRCWKFMAIAVKIIDVALRDDFGYEHILWVYSGRRGVHCWVCDKHARQLTQSERSAVAEYLQVVKGGENQSKKVTISSNRLHPLLKRSQDIASKYFDSLCLEDQDMLGDPEKWGKMLNLIPEGASRDSLSKLMPKCSNSLQRWKTIEAEVQNPRMKSEKRFRSHIACEIILQMTYPRLDINVSKQLNHLLKSPFCIHPKTGRVCVPFLATKVDTFNPENVPTITQLLEEINNYDAEKDGGIPDFKKTSMKQSIQIFENFVNDLSRDGGYQSMDF